MTDHKKEYEEGRLSTTDGNPPKHFDAPAPDPEVKANGQHKSYWVLSEAERAKGFVRPVRASYRHVGRPDGQTKGCGTVTTMGRALAETYAREPGFYGATMCCGCGTHLRVGAEGEFVWEGTTERVGT